MSEINSNALKGWLLKQIDVAEEIKREYPLNIEIVDSQIRCWYILLKKLETNDFQEYQEIHLEWYEQYKAQ